MYIYVHVLYHSAVSSIKSATRPLYCLLSRSGQARPRQFYANVLAVLWGVTQPGEAANISVGELSTNIVLLTNNVCKSCDSSLLSSLSVFTFLLQPGRSSSWAPGLLRAGRICSTDWIMFVKGML